jgi:hypothetical protein
MVGGRVHRRPGRRAPVGHRARSAADLAGASSALSRALEPHLGAALLAKALSALSNPTSPLRLHLAGPEHVAIGESVEFSITPNEDCYLLVVDVSPDGSLNVLYPNAFSPVNFAAKGSRVAIPDGNWRIEAGGPAGRETVRAIATRRPLGLGNIDLDRLGSARIYSLSGAEATQAVQGVLADLARRPVREWATESCVIRVEEPSSRLRDPMELMDLE